MAKRPKLVPLVKGNSFKILQVRSLAGMTMPKYYSINETVILVQKSEALLKKSKGGNLLKLGSVLIITGVRNIPLRSMKSLRPWPLRMSIRKSNLNK